MKLKYAINHLRQLSVALMILSGAFLSGQANGPALEMAAGAGNPTGNGPVLTTSVNFQNNTDNPIGNTFVTSVPTLTATYTLSNSRFATTVNNSTTNIGYTGGAAATIFAPMNSHGAPPDTDFTSAGASAGTGISATSNSGVRMFIMTYPLRVNARATNATHAMVDLTVTFNRPVNNPVLHFGGLGGVSAAGLGFAGRFDLSASNVALANLSLTRLSGNTATSFQTTGLSILNGSATITGTGPTSGSGSVRVNGTGITTLTFVVSLRGDGAQAATTAWAGTDTDTTVGEAFTLGISALESDIQVTKTISNASAAVGSSVNFVVTATNNGPSNNANINITDALPSGYNFGTPTTSAGTYSSGTGVWTIPTLNNGASATLTVTGTVLASGNYTNTATLTSATVSDSNTGNNRATAARLPDSDGDGIFDNTDLDDDNDGIPDALEDNCIKPNRITNGDFASGGTSWATSFSPTPNTTGGISFTGGAVDIFVDNPGNLYPGNIIMANTAAFNLRAGVYYNFSSTLNIISGVANTNFAWVLIDASNNIVQTLQTYRTGIIGAGAVQITAVAAAYPVSFFSTGTGTYRLALTWITDSAASGNAQDVRIDNVTLFAPCDTDNDGIPNYLDLDSDGDGCFDAVEGDENILPVHLNAAGNIRTNAAGTANANSIATVDANGVPVLVNSGGAADVGGDVGQGIGDSQSSVANTQCLDSDNDGIPNNLDLDDDNDGILDTVEDACESEGTPVYINTFGTGARTSDPNVIGHTYVATGAIGDGFYAVTTSAAASETYNQTDLIGGVDAGNPVITAGTTTGRYLMININAPATVNQAIYRVSNIATTIGTRYRFRIDMAGLANGAVAVPDLQISIKDINGNTLATANSGNIGMANDDVWRRLWLNFVASTSTVVLEIVNLQSNGNGNDLGIDNIVLAPFTICDTDGDGIPNSLDLDSDADGCPDVIEGGANFTSGAGYITGNRLNTAVNTLGVPAVPAAAPAVTGYTQAAGQTVGRSQNAALNDCLDSDADGIPDWQDLDDDNDGILDTVECPGANTVVNGDFSAGATGWTFSGGWNLTGGNASNVDNNAVNQTLSQSLTNLDRRMAGNLALNLSIGAGDGSAAGGSTASLEIRLNNILYATLTNTVDRAAGVNNVFITMANGATSNFVPFSTATQTQLVNFTINIPYTGPATAPLAFVMNSGNDDWIVDNVSLPIYICDTDGDGIPNHLDLDSDGDGCSDAIEGGADITVNQLVTAGGTVTGGSTAVNQNLCATGTCVNVQGVPQRSPLPTGYSNTTGQTIGDSQNALVNACYCYKKPVLNAGVTVPTRHGITALNRANSGATDWPIVRQSAWTVLESKTKGFVVNRVAFNNAVTPPVPVGIAAANFVEGMMVYDTTNNCLKIYNGTAWNCYTSQACPQ